LKSPPNSKSTNSKLQQSKLPTIKSNNTNYSGNNLKRPISQINGNSQFSNQQNKRPKLEALKTTATRHIIDLEDDFGI